LKQNSCRRKAKLIFTQWLKKPLNHFKPRIPFKGYSSDLTFYSSVELSFDK